MKNIKQKIALAISMCSLAFSAHAAKPGIYMGIGAGYSHLADFSDIEKDSETNVGAKVFIGYNFNKYFGMEVSYAGYGETEYGEYFSYNSYNNYYVLNYNLKTFSAVGKFYLPADENDKTNNFDLYVLLGAANATAYVDLRSSFMSYEYTDHFSNNAIVGVFGLGVNYNINSNIAAGLEYTFTGGKSGDSDGFGIPQSALVTLNLIYKI
jgi:opacity protein-like surface antigen